MKVAIIGCGSIGGFRAKAVREIEGLELTMVVDIAEDSAQRLADEHGCGHSTDWETALEDDSINIVIVSATNKFHAPISIKAMERGKHVLCEKPLARNVEEAKGMVAAAEKNNVKLKTGFNHRYHPQVKKAREVCDSGAIGDVVFIRARTGHGGRPNYEESWFCDEDLAGGGTFLDNGVHLLDMARWFMGDFVEAQGYCTTNIWSISPLEDNGFGIFKTSDNRIASLHSSWTQWKGYIFMEICGTQGYITIDYTPPRTVVGTRPSRWDEITEETFDFDLTSDDSFRLGLQEFVNAIREDRQPLANGMDGMQAVEMARAVYKSSDTGKAVSLGES